MFKGKRSLASLKKEDYLKFLLEFNIFFAVNINVMLRD